MPSTDEMLRINRETWDIASPTTDKVSSNLPFWGPYGVGPELNLLPKIQGLSFIELCCGSGRSLKYLLDRGAKKVTGVDLAPAQIELTQQKLETYDTGRYDLFCSSMEEQIPLVGTHDIAISIYGLGWATDLDAVLDNVVSYLKPKGTFIWSWEQPIFNRTKDDGEQIVVDRGYFEAEPYCIENFRDCGPAFLYPRTISDYTEALHRNGFIHRFFEPRAQIVEDDFRPRQVSYYSNRKAEMLPSTMIFVCQKM